MGKVKKVRTSNDDRSDVKNPNNSAYQASLNNTANQLNPEHPLNNGQ